jgi:beta-lysine 5,6-aminomutase alpha subunit
MTEAVVTPWLSDRDLALRNVRYVLEAAGNLAEDFAPPPGGFIDRRAHTVLTEAVQLLERIADHPQGLIQAIADGTFGITRRSPDGGKGLDGVFRKSADHFDPALELLGGGLGRDREEEPAGV